MTTFVKRVVKSGKGYIIWIPKDVVNLLKLNDETTLEVKIKKL